MHLASCNHVHFCIAGERAIFLDVARDRYSATPPDVTQALVRAIDGQSCLGQDEILLAPLLDEGLLEISTDETRTLAPTKVMPAANGWSGAGRAGVLQTLAAIIWQLRARTELRRRGLCEIVEHRRSTSPAARRGASLHALIAAYRASNYLYAPHQRCLIKSLGLFDMLRRAGHAPRLLFGVKDEPFAAHAWVEIEDTVLSDAQDEVATYTPIFIL